MSSQLNPNAAEFIPISPNKIPDRDSDISTCSIDFDKSLNSVTTLTQQEFNSEITKRPGQLDLINGQKEDHPIGNEFNDSSIIAAHQTLEDSNILSTKAEFGDSTRFETSLNTSNPFSLDDGDDERVSSDNPFHHNGELEETNILEPVRTIKEFKTFAECLAEPKQSVTTDDSLIPGALRPTTGEDLVSSSSDAPALHQEDIESLDDDLATIPKTPELSSPCEEPQDIAGQERTSSSGFESESGAEETESNILESNLGDNDGFVIETKRLSPPIQSLSFKPIETFGDTNPFGLLENPSPIYKPNTSDITENNQSLDMSKELFSNLDDSDHEDEIIEHIDQTDIKNVELENVPNVLKLNDDQINQDLGFKEDEFAFGAPESEIKANEFIFGAGTSRNETHSGVLADAPLLNENEESKIRLDEQESEREIETKDADFGVDLKQSIDAIASVFDTNFITDSNVCNIDFSDERHLVEQEMKKGIEYEAKDSDFQFDPTDEKLDFISNSFDTGSNMICQLEDKIQLEREVPKEQSFDTSKEVTTLHENEKESDTAIENIVEEVITQLNTPLLESPVAKEPVDNVKGPKEELNLDLSDTSKGPASKKDASPLSPTAQPFVPTHVPVVEPLCKQVILEKKFTEPNSESNVESVGVDFVEFEELNESNISKTEEHISSPQLDLDAQICLLEPEINNVREGINEIIKEAEIRSQGLVSEHKIFDDISETNVPAAELGRPEILSPEPVSQVLENELIVHSTEPVPDLLTSLQTDKQPLPIDNLNIVQEAVISQEKEENNEAEALDIKTVGDVASTTGTPPSTPAPGVVGENAELKKGLLAAAAAVAAAGVVTTAAVVADKATVKKTTTTQVKKTLGASKKPTDIIAKSTAKPASTTTKPATKPAAAKPSVPEVKKPALAATSKPASRTTVPSKPASTTVKPASKPTLASKTNVSPLKSTVGQAKPATSTIKSTGTGGSKPSTPLSKPSTPVSKTSPSTATLRPTSASKLDSGKASPTKPVAVTKTAVSIPKLPAKVPPKVSEKKLTNGDVLKPDITKKPEAATTKKTTSTKSALNSRPPSATSKTSTITSKAPSTKPAPPKPLTSFKPAVATSKPLAKPTTTTTVSKTRTLTSTTKSIDKTGKDNANKEIISDKTGSKNLANKMTTKKTDIKSAGSGKPKPVTKPGVDKEKLLPTQEGLITTTNGYSVVIENGIKKDDSPLDNSHQDIINAI